MKNKSIALILGMPILLALGACSDEKGTPPSGKEKSAAVAPSGALYVDNRWYSPEQVKRGEALFQQNCAECHKPDASGDPNWKQTDAEGKLPPPPLNGTAHAWHHPMPMLQQIVKNGGIPMGGSMPAFKEKLTPEQINDILAWVQSHWPDKTYTTWMQINQRKS
ncbi:c-type cytochrome [Thiolapillus sp.]